MRIVPDAESEVCGLEGTVLVCGQKQEVVRLHITINDALKTE